MNSSLVRHIQRFPDENNWNYVSLSLHPDVSLTTLKTLKDKPWNWHLLTRNINWNWEWVREFPDKPWDWQMISSFEFFTWDWVREFPDAPWDWKDELSSEKIKGIENVLEFPDKPWNWYTLTLGNEITTKNMIENPNFPWTVNQLLFTEIDENEIEFIRYYRSHYDGDAWCDHTSRTPWSIIKKNMDLPWVFWFVRIRHPNEFEECDIKYLYTRKWNWKHLSEVLNFRKIVSVCVDIPWDFDALSKNKTVTYRDVLNFPDIKWNYNFIHLDIDKKEWNSANTIKRYWKKCVTDPSFALCRKIVLGDLFGITLNIRNDPTHE